jgi:GNAT superfamily N-acetyltransferase
MITLRPAMQSDAAAMARIHRAARAAALPLLPVLHTPEEALDYFSDGVLREMRVTIAADGAEMCGFIACADDFVHHLYVDPAHWRAGVGLKLIAFAKASARCLQLWTFQDNAIARAFYARHRFVETEFTDGSRNEERTPDVRLVWQV